MHGALGTVGTTARSRHGSARGPDADGAGRDALLVATGSMQEVDRIALDIRRMAAARSAG